MTDTLASAVTRFMDSVDARLKSMRSELLTELRAEVSRATSADDFRGPPGPEGPAGPQGPPGANGKNAEPAVSIDDVEVRGGRLWVALTDGKSIDAGEVRGEKGEPGEPGRDGKDGKDGADGRDGEAGRDGADGKDGVGIEALEIADDNLVVRLTDGTEKRLGRVVGRDGKDGKDGRDGERGERGEKGDTGPAGSKGERGERGEKGADGITKDHLDLILDLKLADRLDDLRVENDTLMLGKKALARIPGHRYKQLWQEDGEYFEGDTVTFASSVWVCLKDGTKAKPGVPPNADWQLAVKQGRDGRNRDQKAHEAIEALEKRVKRLESDRTKE